jgi:hypothetical protein
MQYVIIGCLILVIGCLILIILILFSCLERLKDITYNTTSEEQKELELKEYLKKYMGKGAITPTRQIKKPIPIPPKR